MTSPIGGLETTSLAALALADTTSILPRPRNFANSHADQDFPDKKGGRPLGGFRVNISRLGFSLLAVLALLSGACGDKKAPPKVKNSVPGGGGAVGTLPAGWQKSDIGAVGQSGDSGYSSGVFSVSGSGQDIWDAA